MGCWMVAVAFVVGSAAWLPLRAQDTDPMVTTAPALGLTVDGVIGSNQGGIRLPDGTLITARPRFSLSDPFGCEPPPGQSKACQIGGAWDYCGLSMMSFANVNPFSNPRCRVEFGPGGWVVKAESGQSEMVSCTATCMRMEMR